MDEVANLNSKVASLVKEKEDIMAMKVSQLGLKPGESPVEENAGDETIDPTKDSRFAKLTEIDEEYKNYRIKIMATRLPCRNYVKTSEILQLQN